jgi:hypothetical protein
MTAPSLPALLLSPDELMAVTGYRLSAQQIRWLQKKGWRYEVNGNRRPIVARKYAEKMLGCGGSEEHSYTPDFSALRKA